VIVVASTTLPAAILAESALTFLGVGLPLGEPSWGNDLGPKARTYFDYAPWLAIFPGVALSLTVLAFNLLGDALRDELDPRLRGSGLRG
jgi:ABC-type dipeptide/oligopeptide/nickel transport system permease subunit